MLTIDKFGLKPDRVYLVKEVGAAFRISRSTLYRWIVDERFPPGVGGCVKGRKRTTRRFPGKEIAEWLEAGKIYFDTEERQHAN